MKKLISIVTPVFNESDNLERYVQVVNNSLPDSEEFKFQFILVDDGSYDDSWEKITSLTCMHERISGIRLSRNFGSHIAISAGINHSGDCEALAILACDLQDPPSTILAFLNNWKNGSQIVWGKRRSREDPLWKRVSSYLFFIVVKKFAMPEGSLFCSGSFLLVDRKVIDCYREFNERNRITFALFAWSGFEQSVVEYDRISRKFGSSGWNLRRMIGSMYDVIMGYSHLPITIFLISSIALFSISLLSTIYVCMNWYFGNPVQGWTGIMSLMSFFFSVQFFLMSLVGEYLKRIHTESIERPLYFISSRVGG